MQLACPVAAQLITSHAGLELPGGLDEGAVVLICSCSLRSEYLLQLALNYAGLGLLEGLGEGFGLLKGLGEGLALPGLADC